MTTTARMTGIGKMLMAIGELKLGSRTLKLVLSNDDVVGTVLADEAANLAGTSGNYLVGGVDIAGTALAWNGSPSAGQIAVQAANVALTGITATFKVALLYLPGTYTGLPISIGADTMVDPIVAVIDFGGTVTVNGDYVILWPNGNMFVLA